MLFGSHKTDEEAEGTRGEETFPKSQLIHVIRKDLNLDFQTLRPECYLVNSTNIY